MVNIVYLLVFQPSLPARGATEKRDFWRIIIKISTLAPREGSDRM